KQLLNLDENQEISLDSIQSALIRYTDGLRRQKELLEEKIAGIIAKTVLELKNDLIVMIVPVNVVIKAREDIFTLLNVARFFHLIQGNNTFTIIADQELESKILEIFSVGPVIQAIKDQSALILISPSEIVNVPGVVSYLHGLLAYKNINITQSISCYKDTILIINRLEALEAYSLIEKQILLFRRLIKDRDD
ncbi:MAG: ACT domain-containing protein, partial [Promethearchaeota archaeon]